MGNHENLWFTKYKNDPQFSLWEDGVLREIFNKIGLSNKFLIECGAANGVKGSSAYSLIHHDGWKGLLVEANETDFEILVENYKKFKGVNCLNRFVSFEGGDRLDRIFEELEVPNEPDLFTLDIDGNEYHVWDTMSVYKPRVMVVEFNPTIPNEVSFIQPRDMKVQQGSSLKALNELAIVKNYRLVAVTDFNAFFVCEKDSVQFKDYDNSLDALRPRNIYETKLYQLYDGTLKISGNKKLIWHNQMIDEDLIQVVSPINRLYKNGISSKAWVRKLKYFVRKTPLYPLVRLLRKVSIFRRIIQ